MAVGYTRQKAAEIAAGATITDTDLEAEYDAIVAAFNASSGHNHNGTVGGGALIPLTSGVTGSLPIANGGTSGTSVATARTALSLTPGTDVQVYSARLTDIAALAVTDSNIIVGNGSTWVAETGSTARTSLGAAGLADANTYSSTARYSSANTLQNNNTSVIDLYNTSTTWHALVVGQNSTSNTSSALMVLNANSGVSTEVLKLRWQSGSPADNDEAYLNFNYLGEATFFDSNRISFKVTDATDASADSETYFWTMNAGTLAARGYFGQGFVVGAPTGGDKGTGTINATAVYDDNVILTDYVFDYYHNKEVTYEDQRMQDLADMFNPVAMNVNDYSMYWLVNNHLMGMPSQDSYFRDRPSTGQMIQKLWETVEVQAIHIHELNERLKAVERTKKCECK